MTATKHFTRGLTDPQMRALRDAMLVPGHWWKDLLSLWRPSGYPTGSDGLRLAIRNETLNLYRKGQSVARVSFDRSDKPALSVHAKYVIGDAERLLPNLSYARLIEGQLTHPGLASRPYEGAASLQAWIKVIDEQYTTPRGEKPLIDDLLSCEENANVIDLEMALPAWEGNTAAPRMDLVTIEDVQGRLTVFFGEVKRVDDARIRCSGAHIANEYPKVRRQLADYQTYLTEDAHRASIAVAYTNTAARLVELNAMAVEVRGPFKLGPEIERLAKGEPLEVARDAALVVLCVGRYSRPAWETHKKRLQGGAQRIRLVELEGAVPMNLGAVQ